MLKPIFLVLLLLLSKMEGKEEILKLNDFKTIHNGETLDFTTDEESIAYFDSLDRNCLVYIKESNSENKERIDGKFYKLKANTNYHIDIKLYDLGSPSVLRRYLYPLDLSSESNKEIIITDDSTNYLYLIKNKKFILDFQINGHKMIALSQKTKGAKVIIDDLSDLNEGYIEIEGKQKITLTTKDNDALIEFLSEINVKDGYESLNSDSYDDKELNYKTSILIINYTQKTFLIHLHSSESFKYSFSYGFGLGEELFHYSSISNNPIEETKIDNQYVSNIQFYDIFRNVTLVQGEQFLLTITIEKSENQKVVLKYLQYSELDPLMDESLTENYCQDIINNMKNIFEYYVFSDIAKNPPKIDSIPNYHHEKIDFQDRLNKVSIKNRYFYEFYQEIEMILAAVKDRHLNIYAEETPQGIQFKSYYAILPFKFKIKQYNSQYRIFIELNNYINNYGKNVQDFLKKNKDIPLKSINNIDPFDYIQNWSKFRGLKNPHAQFSIRIKEISFFYFVDHPLNYSDISLNEYEFDNDELIRIPYIVYILTPLDLEFKNYLNNYQNGNKDTNNILPIDKIYDNFLIFKGKKKRFDSKLAININWDISHIEQNKIIKCRVDNDKQVNVIYQNSFGFNKTYEAMGKMLNCMKLFLTNKYPVVVIESQNGGGFVILYALLLQILQTRIEMKDYRSYRVTSISEDFLKNKNFYYYISTDDCKQIFSYEDIKKFYEDSYGDNSIHHNRTSPIDSINIVNRLALQEFREEVKNSENLKRPTDIFILTDSYSFSATSGLIKGFQNTGGAVIVGYYGNPMIEGKELYDGSQSPSEVVKLNGTKLKDNLKKNHFKIEGVTFGESYYFHQKDVKDQIPREYSLDPVDFRINIYSDYSDEKYNEFIDEALKIYKSINEDNNCNKNNDKLLLHSDNCYNINGDVHAHGGYKCGDDEKWNMSNCQPYYCDFGYYFDQIQKKCIENCKFPNVKSYFIYEEKFDKIFTIEPNMIYYFIFTLFDQHKYFYDNKLVNKSILIIQGNQIYDYDIEIKEVYTDKNLISLGEDYSSYSFITSKESIFFIENEEKDYVLYLDNTYKSSKTQLKFAKYESEMSIDDMLNPSSKYYSDYDKSTDILSKNETYLLYVNFKELDPFNIFINPIYREEIIEINGLEIDFLYLEKDKTYTLKFENNSIKRMLKLSRETLKSKVIITDKDIFLDSENLYYIIEDNYKGELKLNIQNDNALIEFLFKQDDSELEILDFEKKEFILNKKYNILSIPKKYSSNIIDIELNRNEFLTNFIIYLAYSIPPYNYFSIDDEENIFTMEEKFSFTLNEHYKGDLKLMENEYYCVMIENFGEDVFMKLTIREDKKSNSVIFANWKIGLIGIILILL